MTYAISIKVNIIGPDYSTSCRPDKAIVVPVVVVSVTEFSEIVPLPSKAITIEQKLYPIYMTDVNHIFSVLKPLSKQWTHLKDWDSILKNVFIDLMNINKNGNSTLGALLDQV